MGVIVLALLTLHPISLSARSGNWPSIVLLLVLDAAVISTWVIGERRRARALRGEESPGRSEP